MNVQRLIEKYKELWNEHSPFYEPVPYTSMVELFLKELKRLDEPEKVTIPQFVAGWIEYCKFTHVNLQYALVVGDVYFYNYANQKDFSKLKEFLETENNQVTFARAWLDGYEVEKEKRYLVKVKGMSEENTYLTFRFGHTWMLSNFEECEEFRLHHTRKQLEEAGFAWVFDCEGIAIEEVE